MYLLRVFTLLFSCIVLSAHGSEIIAGKEVAPHSLKYMALLVIKYPDCGGILIHPSWVLTAAHCKDIRKVLLGVHSIKAAEKKSRQVRKVKREFPHPSYNKDTNENDLMLLKLDKPVKPSNTVQCMDLSNTIKDPAKGTTCMVAGWGQTNNKIEKMSDVLMSVNVTVVARAVCNSADYYNFDPVITSGMICAGSNGKAVADTCVGDSGGPLICSGRLVGVTSFGRDCGLVKKPGVYSYLSPKQVNWIKKTIKSKI